MDEKNNIIDLFEKDENGKLKLDEVDHLPILSAEGRRRINSFLKYQKELAEKKKNETNKGN